MNRLQKLLPCLVALVLVFSLIGGWLFPSQSAQAGGDQENDVVCIIDLKDAELIGIESDEAVDLFKNFASQTQEPIVEFLNANGARVLNTF